MNKESFSENSQIDFVKNTFLESADIQTKTAAACSTDIISAAKLMTQSLQNGNKILLCGNGGSAADCQHMATELLSQIDRDLDRPGLAAIALTADTTFITGYSNDFEYSGIFERQVNALGSEGDVLVAISTSGDSANILKAVEAASKKNISTIGLTGDSGKLKSLVDLSIEIPSNNIQFIQESHIVTEHIICMLIEKYLFSE
ncbi:MAG: SIS domain-containing protein [Dehalococcoidia bacterium]